MLVRGEKLTGQELALRPVKSQREPEAIMPIPVLLGEQGLSRSEMHQGRFVRRACPRAPPGDQVQLGELQPLRVGRDEPRATIELVHDLKNSFLPLVCRRRGSYQSSDPQVGLYPLIFRD